MPVNKVVAHLWGLGQFFNPDMPTGVTEADLPKLKLHDDAVRTALRSFQKTMQLDYDELGVKMKGKTPDIDGELGPVTEELFKVPRCGHPDYGPEAEAATGSGSWPADCHKDWPGAHTFTVQVDKRNMPSFLGSKDDPNSVFEQAWKLQRLAYANMGIVFIREDDNSQANTLVTWTRGNGWIGLAIVPNRFSCGLRIWAKFDTRYSPSQMLDQWARLLAHEFGHNMGSGHDNRGGIMYPSIRSGKFTPTAWRGDPRESWMKARFGGDPIDLEPDTPDEPDPPTDPDPPEPPGPNEYWVRGVQQFMRGDEVLYESISVKKPRV